MWTVVLCLVLCITVQCSHISNIIADGKIQLHVTTTQHPDFFTAKDVGFNATKDASAVIATLNTSVKHQTIVGFGGTFTDSTSFTLNMTHEPAKENLLDLLFGDKGIGLSLCRVPIGGTAFSKRAYSLDDHDGDTTLEQFALQAEDIEAKVMQVFI